MSILREIAIKLGLDVDAASFAEGELAAKALEKGLEGIVEVAKKAVEFFVETAEQAIHTASAFNDISQAAGVTTDTLQELQYAGSLASVSAEEMAHAIMLLSRTMNAASKGGDEQAKVFEKIGVKIKNAGGKLRPVNEVIGNIADHFKAMPDSAEKTALSMELFGRSGARMISVLNDGSAGLNELSQEAHDLGLIMDQDTIKLGDDVGDNIDRLKAMANAIRVQIGSALFPILKRITDQIINWAKANKELIRQKVDAAMRFVAKAAQAAADAFDVLSGTVKLLADGLRALLIEPLRNLMALFEEVGPVGRRIIVGLALTAAIALAPFTALAAVIAGLLLILNSVQRFREGRDSLFGDWMKMLNDWAKPSADDPWWLKAIKELVLYMQKALGIAEKLGVAGDKSKSAIPEMTTAERAASLTVPGAAYVYGKKKLQQSEEKGGLIYGYNQARDAGLNPFSALYHASDYADSQLLPPGQGVTRAPAVNMSRQYNIYQSPGMNAADVVNLIQQHEDAQNEQALEALGD